jgi:two-component system chemotaxis response regulator CheB
MNNKNIIVIGASAGGFDALKELAAALPTDLDASIFIVWHMAPDVRGMLPRVLNRNGNLFAAHAVDGEPIRRGRIYVAPPDHHLVLEENRMRLTRGPRENRFRPAIDPLFRSAAYIFRSRVIGVVLSGALDDGSAGLWTIKKYGGTTVVQDPEDAQVPSMPLNAIRAADPDHVVPVSRMPSLLVELTSQPASENIVSNKTDDDIITKTEINIAMEKSGLDNNLLGVGKQTVYTCPECHGVLTQLKEGGLIRFRCHTGHAFSADTLLAAISESIEESIWNAIRNVQESVMLLNHMGDHFAEENQPKLAAIYFKKAKEAEERAKHLRETVFTHEHLSAENMQHEADIQGSGNGHS